MTNPSELVGDVDVCPHCRGTGQPHGIMGGPEHGLCSWCKGTGQKFSSPRNPSETRDSELVRRLRNEATCFETDGGADPEVDAGTARLLREAADTIDRLTSSGEAVATITELGEVMVASPSEFQAMFDAMPEVPHGGIKAIEVYTHPAHASPREGHVEVPTHRHVKRGTDYVLIGFGKMQAEHWNARNPHGILYRSVDMREVAIYRSVDDGSLWARPREEFEDGRFAALPHNQGETKP